MTARSLSFMALLVGALGFGPAALAQPQAPPVLQTGTTLAFEGIQAYGACIDQGYFSYEQFSKLAGRVILPETEAKVYDFIENWGRDSGIQIMRFSPNGDVFAYYLGVEQKFSSRAPVGTHWEFTDPDSGNVLRHQIVGDGITVTLPTDVVYNDLVRMNVYCTNCGPAWVLLESYWLSPDMLGFPVLYLVWDAGNSCAHRWLWFVSLTRKQEGW